MGHNHLNCLFISCGILIALVQWISTHHKELLDNVWTRRFIYAMFGSLIFSCMLLVCMTDIPFHGKDTLRGFVDHIDFCGRLPGIVILCNYVLYGLLILCCGIWLSRAKGSVKEIEEGQKKKV